MRKTLFIAFLCLFSLTMQAQDKAVLDRILQTNSAVKSFETDLTNILAKHDGTTNRQTGTLYFSAPDRFAALFTTGKHMIVNVDHMKVNMGIFNGKFKLRSSGMMRSLGNIFLYGFQGRCEDLAKENNYSIKVSEKGPYQQVYCTNNRRSIFGIGYKTVIFNYDKDTLLIKEIILIDNKDNVDTYTISNTKWNAAVKDSVYAF